MCPFRTQKGAEKMAGKKFNLNDLLNKESSKKEEAQKYETHMISVYNLIPSDENFYSTENVEDLKQSIELNGGVKQNLIVTNTENGKYRIISGHRRHKASMELTEEGKKEYEKVPCIIETELDKDKEQLLLIMSNSTTRILTDYEKTKQAELLKDILSNIKKKENIPGRTREIIADILNTSPTNIARMESITKKLTPELKEEFKKENIGITKAYELSKKTEEEQKEALDEYKESGDIKLESKKENKSEVPAAVIEKEDKQEQTESLKNNYEKIKSMTIEQMAEFLYIHLSKKGLKKTLEWLQEIGEER